jgi:hypothetical protein
MGKIPVLIVVRGLPGSGKSSLAAKIAELAGFSGPYEADQYFMGLDGVYRYDRTRIGQAHRDCQNRVRAVLGRSVPVVSNTCVGMGEMGLAPYCAMGAVVAIDLFDGGAERFATTNIHNVPPEAINAMRAGWEWVGPKVVGSVSIIRPGARPLWLGTLSSRASGAGPQRMASEFATIYFGGGVR